MTTLRFFLLCIFGYHFLVLPAQKHDYIWQLGYNGTFQMNFNTPNLSFTTNSSVIPIDRLSLSMCDVNGNFLFASNGFKVADATGNLMQNGTGLHGGDYMNAWITAGNPSTNSGLALPSPAGDGKYYIFQAYFEWTNGFRVSKLIYSQIDMNQNNGLGAVIAKNVTVIEDTLEYYSLTAVKHGNGRDWWVVVPERYGNYIYLALLTPDGIKKIDKQKVDDVPRTAAVFSTFSPDGAKYIQITSGSDHIRSLPFNRCNGSFSTAITITPDTVVTSGGIAISPNSRFVYKSTGNVIFQYDLWANTPNANEQIVGTWDGTLNSNNQPIGFGASPQLGPDGKIYFSANYSCGHYHVIESPDSLGTACNLVQHLSMPNVAANAMPHFPNYRLGAAIGSGCDTLSVSNQSAVNSKQIKVYPNPARDKLQLESSEVLQKGTFVLYNLAGQAVLRQEVFGNAAEIKVENMAEGMYFYRIFEGNIEMGYGKLVISK